MNKLLLTMMLLGALLLAVAANAAPAPPAVEKVVHATGVSAVNAVKDLAVADATQAAQRRAVLTVVGLYLTDGVRQANGKMVDDLITKRMADYLKETKVTDEKYADSVATVTISATVRADLVKADLDSLCRRLAPAGSPRIIIDIYPTWTSDNPLLAQNLLTQQFVAQGFKVIDGRTITDARFTETLKMLREHKRETARIAELQAITDIIVVGQANCRDLGKMADQDIYSAEAWLDAQVIKADTGEIITAAQGTTAGPKVAFTDAKAVDNAVRAAIDDWQAKNYAPLLQKLSDPTATITLSVSNCNAKELADLDVDLNKLAFVRQTTLVSYDDGLAKVDVRYLGDIKDLMRDLGTFRVVKLTIETSTANTVRARVRP